MSIEELIIKLTVSINNEDLDTTMNIINILNNKVLTESESNKLQQALSLQHDELINNKCIDYVLENLNIPFYKNILFLRKHSRIKQEKNSHIIENYIQHLLDKDEYPYAENEQQIVRFLIESISLLNDKNKKNYYFNLVQNKFFKK